MLWYDLISTYIWDPSTNSNTPLFKVCKNLFWAWWGVFCIGSKNFFYKKVFYRPKELDSRCSGPESKICILSPPLFVDCLLVLVCVDTCDTWGESLILMACKMSELGLINWLLTRTLPCLLSTQLMFYAVKINIIYN